MHAQLHNASFPPGELQSVFHKYTAWLKDFTPVELGGLCPEVVP